MYIKGGKDGKGKGKDGPRNGEAGAGGTDHVGDVSSPEGEGDPMATGDGTRTPRPRRERSVGARSSGGEAMDQDVFQLVGRGGRWAKGHLSRPRTSLPKVEARKEPTDRMQRTGKAARQRGAAT